jgi:putative redox protein
VRQSFKANAKCFPAEVFRLPPSGFSCILAGMDTNASLTTQQTEAAPPNVVVRGNAREFLQEVVSGPYHLRADEPVSYGGSDAAPGPYDYLLIGLGVCTSMTIGLYARRKQFPLENITVSLRHSRIHARDCEECETKEGLLDRIDVEVELTGALTADQHSRLMAVAAKCPVHRTLKSEINIRLSRGAAISKPPA